MCFRIVILTLTVVSGRNTYLFNLHDHYAVHPHLDYGYPHHSANERHTPYGFQRREVQYNTPANFNTEPGVDPGYAGRPRGRDHYSFSTEYHNRNFEHTSNVHQNNFGTRSHQTFNYGSEDFNRHGGSDRQDHENRNQFEFHSKSGFDNPNLDRTRINSEDNSRITENRRSKELANNRYHESVNRNLGTDFGNQYVTPTRSQNIIIDINNGFHNHSSNTRDNVTNNNNSGEFANRKMEVEKTTADNEIVSKTTEKIQTSKENRTKSTGVSVNNGIKGNRNETEDKWIWDITNTTSTTAAPDLNNRAVFTGDRCPSNMAKIGGKCVEID